MNGNPQEKQPAVRPGLLVVLLIALGGTLYWRFFMQPQPVPISPTPSITVTAPPANNFITDNEPEPKDFKINTGPISKRDIFLPPLSIIAARRRKDNDVTRPEQPVWNEPRLIKPDQEVSKIPKEDENPEKPILKVIMGTASTQVIIVRYQNKSYLLKLGEILPGTEYRVAEISGSTVTMLSPKGLLKLDRKERAK